MISLGSTLPWFWLVMSQILQTESVPTVASMFEMWGLNAAEEHAF